jgi:hypothetical protein
MLDPSVPSDATPNDSGYFVGLVIAVFGYVTALTGCLAFFKIPLALTFGMLLGGFLIALLLPRWLDRRLAFTQSSRVFLATILGGQALIVALLILFANPNWKTKTGYIHPAGFPCSWCVLVAATFHCVSIIQQTGWKNRNTDNPITDYNIDQESNPYAPPKHSQLRTNNPMDRSGGSAAS